MATVKHINTRTKHINVVYHWFHYYVGKVLNIIKVESENQKANIFTKALDEQSFGKFVSYYVDGSLVKRECCGKRIPVIPGK